MTPAFIGINIAALLMAALFLFTVYSTDQTPKRSSEYLFGEPAVSDSDSSGYSASEETEAASGGESSDNEGDDEEEE